MALWTAIAFLVLMIAFGVIGFRGEPTTRTAVARIMFALSMIGAVASLAILAS